MSRNSRTLMVVAIAVVLAAAATMGVYRAIKRIPFREVPVDIGEDDVGHGVARAKMLSRHGTDRSAPDQENIRRVGGYAVEPRSP